MGTVEHPRSHSQISENLLSKLSTKLVSGGTTYSERATVSHFTFDMDVELARAFANHVDATISTLQSALKEDGVPQTIQALQHLSRFISLTTIRGLNPEDPEIGGAWDSFIATLYYPGQVGFELDIDAGLQRVETAIVVEQVIDLVAATIVDFRGDKEE